MKYVAFLLIIFKSTQSFSQTKSETESWILDKLKEYSKDLYTKPIDITDDWKHTYKNFRFNLENGVLTVEYDNIMMPNTSDPRLERDLKTESKWKEEISIGEIKDIECGSKLRIEAYDYSIKCYRNGELQKSKDKILLIGFSCMAEENLEVRLKKAFEHLKTFYPRNKRKEAF